MSRPGSQRCRQLNFMKYFDVPRIERDTSWLSRWIRGTDRKSSPFYTRPGRKHRTWLAVQTEGRAPGSSGCRGHQHRPGIVRATEHPGQSRQVVTLVACAPDGNPRPGRRRGRFLRPTFHRTAGGKGRHRVRGSDEKGAKRRPHRADPDQGHPFGGREWVFRVLKPQRRQGGAADRALLRCRRGHGAVSPPARRSRSPR